MWHWLCQINRIFQGWINRDRDDLIRSGRSVAWGVSIGIHAVILGTLALVTLTQPRSVAFISVLADWAEPEAVVRVDPPLRLAMFPAQADVTASDSAPGGRAGNAGPIAAGVETAQEQATRRIARAAAASETVLPLDFDPRLPAARDLTVSALGRKLGKGFATGGGFGSGLGDGTGDGSGSQFFDLASAGTKIVFVLDGSGSMTEPHSEARTKLDRVKIELFRSILGMPDEMEFYVIFFNRFSVPMKASSLQSATPENKRKYLEWVAKVQGGGGTDPSEALKLAFELQPDVIYLLTDGVFNPKIAKEVDKRNTRGVAVHTICFGSTTGEVMLQDIARKNHGTYKFVP
ncbi:MAG TPA: VWA domain-containing protein [Planctomycetaceae bacterium]|jgi:hypothetical protein